MSKLSSDTRFNASDRLTTETWSTKHNGQNFFLMTSLNMSFGKIYDLRKRGCYILLWKMTLEQKDNLCWILFTFGGKYFIHKRKWTIKIPRIQFRIEVNLHFPNFARTEDQKSCKELDTYNALIFFSLQTLSFPVFPCFPVIIGIILFVLYL